MFQKLKLQRPKVIYMAEMGPILWEVWRPLVFLFGSPVFSLDLWDLWDEQKSKLLSYTEAQHSSVLV